MLLYLRFTPINNRLAISSIFCRSNDYLIRAMKRMLPTTDYLIRAMRAAPADYLVRTMRGAKEQGINKSRQAVTTEKINRINETFLYFQAIRKTVTPVLRDTTTSLGAKS